MADEIETKNVAETDAGTQKKVSAKKLPALFRKTYSEQAFKKKILKKIYIEEDRELVKSIFSVRETEGKNGKTLKSPKLSVPKDGKFDAVDVRQLKKIAKSVKKNRGRIRWIPLAAVVGLVVAIVLVVSAFKNPIAKMGIKYACESAFGAKTDVGSVDVRLLGISLTVGNLAVGDKNSKESNYMKNLFEFEKLTVSFNLTQAVRGRFIAENLDVSGIQFGTDRTTSCYIPPKETHVAEKTDEEESEFMKKLSSRAETTRDELKQMVNDMLGGTDVNEIVSSLQSQLKTPAAAEEAKSKSMALVEKWKAKPDEMKGEIDKFSSEVKKYQTIDMKQFEGHPEKVAEAIAEITKTVNTMNELKSSVETTVNEVKSDAEGVKALTLTLSDAVKSDTEMVSMRLNAVSNAFTNSQKIFTNALESLGYDLLGKYYPYLKKGVNYALELKSKSAAAASKPAKTETKGATNRLKGRTIPFSRAYPTFWVKNVSASGFLDKSAGRAFSGSITHVSSNQDVAGNPTTANAKFDFGGVNHSGSLCLDVRSNTTAPLISADYAGKGFSASMDGTSVAKGYGIPSVSASADVTLSGSAGATGFSAGGKIGLSPLTLTSDGFQNPVVTKYYNEALSSVKSLDLGYEVSYSESDGIAMALLGDFAQVFANSLKTAALSFANDAKDAAFKALNEQISKLNNDTLAKIADFSALNESIDFQNMNLDSMKKVLEDKMKEIQAAGQKAAESAIQDALKDVPISSALPSETSNPASDILKGLSGGGGKSSDAATGEKSDASSEKSDSDEKVSSENAADAVSKGIKSLFGR